MGTLDRPTGTGSTRRPLLAGVLAVAIALAPASAGVRAARAATGFDNLPRIGEAAADELSPQTELEIGEAIRRDFRHQGLLLEDPELVDYLNQLGNRLGSTTPAAGYGFEFFAVRDRSINAFAVPGGFIGVHSGLILAAQNESELASVLAHEMGHVTQRHIARMLARGRQSSVVQIAAAVLAILAARSNPQAAGGFIALGGGVVQDQMLAFSRDAEREADRVGLEILRQAGYDANAAVAFFGRLQDATRIYETGAPTYMRTHPVTTDRIADIQNRLSDQRYRQHVDSTEFTLLRAKLEALADTSPARLERERGAIERRLRDRSFVSEAATRFQLAIVATEQGDLDAARAAVVEARRALGEPHPMLERLAIDIDRRAGRRDAALAASQDALARFGASRALAHQHGALLLDARRFADAAAFLEAQVRARPSDPEAWRMLSQARFGADQPIAGRRAAAEHYVLEGGLLAAIEQLRLAQREAGNDFYVGSQIDARLRELQARYTREQLEAGAD
jgi:predicted Zn-dependent protease